MGTIFSTIMVSALKSFYEFTLTSNAAFYIGLNLYSGAVPLNDTCTAYDDPGCVLAAYSGEYKTPPSSPYVMEASVKTFEATFKGRAVPKNSYTLKLLSLVACIRRGEQGYPWPYQLGLVDYSGLSIPMEANTEYTITITQKLTYSIYI